jgi:hypothetical protein
LWSTFGVIAVLVAGRDAKEVGQDTFPPASTQGGGKGVITNCRVKLGS